MGRNILFKLLDGFLLILIGYKALGMLFRVYSISIVTRFINGNVSTRPQLSYIVKGIEMENRIDYLFIITFLILLSSWFYIKYRSVHRATHIPLNYRPIWAAFSFVIPVFNLLAPYKIMSDIWLVQNKNMSAEQDGKQNIKTWWILSIIVFIISRLLKVLAEQVEGIEGFLRFEYYYLFFFAFTLHYILLTRKLVRMIGA